jgi:hypothetical protein
MQSALKVDRGKKFYVLGWLVLNVDLGIVLALVSIGLSLLGAKYAQWKQKAKQLKKTVHLLVDALSEFCS